MLDEVVLMLSLQDSRKELIGALRSLHGKQGAEWLIRTYAPVTPVCLPLRGRIPYLGHDVLRSST